MAPTNPRTSSEVEREHAIPNFVPSEFAEFGKKRIEALVEMQRELLETFESIHQAWFERAKSETELTSEWVNKLTSARSVPEQAEAYRDCLSKRMELLADDSRRVLADTQKVMQLGARLFANGAKDAA